MEMTGAALRPSPAAVFSGRRLRAAPSRISMRGSCFADDGHLKYYSSSAVCDDGDKKMKKKMKEVKKRRAKLVEGLAEDLDWIKSMGLLAEETDAKRISDAAKMLLEQLRKEEEAINEMMDEEKEMKKKLKKEAKAAKKQQKKEEKAAASIMRGCCNDDDDSSSSSSESSDSECEKGEVFSMRCRSNVAMLQGPPQTTAIPITVPQIPAIPMALPQVPASTMACQVSSRISSIAVLEKPVMSRIEVCMGGKCKKSGSIELLQQFEEMVGGESQVVGCKCMGKCKEGPNVRVVNLDQNENNVNAPQLEIPLCVGVGLDDVSSIVAGLFGNKDAGLIAA